MHVVDGMRFAFDERAQYRRVPIERVIMAEKLDTEVVQAVAMSLHRYYAKQMLDKPQLWSAIDRKDRSFWRQMAKIAHSTLEERQESSIERQKVQSERG